MTDHVALTKEGRDVWRRRAEAAIERNSSLGIMPEHVKILCDDLDAKDAKIESLCTDYSRMRDIAMERVNAASDANRQHEMRLLAERERDEALAEIERLRVAKNVLIESLREDVSTAAINARDTLKWVTSVQKRLGR